MWVQLQTTKQIEVNGMTRRYLPGDWVEVGRQTALRWITEGSARASVNKESLLPADAGLLIYQGEADTGRYKAQGLEVRHGELGLPFLFTALVDYSFPFRDELLFPGFNVLTNWQMAVPFMDYDILAVHVGTAEEQARTQAIIRDLRVPLYDPRLMFVRRCKATRSLIDLYRAELLTSTCPPLAFLRALYQIKPLILALPYTWMTDKGRDKYER